MRQARASPADGIGLIFFLDVHVERIQVQIHVLRTHGFDQLQSLLAGVEEVGFKTVQRLDD